MKYGICKWFCWWRYSACYSFRPTPPSIPYIAPRHVALKHNGTHACFFFCCPFIRTILASVLTIWRWMLVLRFARERYRFVSIAHRLRTLTTPHTVCHSKAPCWNVRHVSSVPKIYYMLLCGALCCCCAEEDPFVCARASYALTCAKTFFYAKGKGTRGAQSQIGFGYLNIISNANM